MLHWHEVKKTDKTAVGLADLHYSRGKIGSREIGPPGQKVVLLTPNGESVWGSHRPAPWTEAKRMDGFVGSSCFLFRNDNYSAALASELIREAVGYTASLWGVEPWITYVARDKVKPVMVHGKHCPGWTYLKAGFHYVSTKEKTKHGPMDRLEMDDDEVLLCLAEYLQKI